MAERPQFTRHNGKSAIENVKQEKLYDVLLLACMNKDLDDIIAAHYEKQRT